MLSEKIVQRCFDLSRVIKCLCIFSAPKSAEQMIRHFQTFNNIIASELLNFKKYLV